MIDQLGRKRTFFLMGFGALLVIASGCVTLETQKEEISKEPTAISQRGTYHKVKAGETIWRIAKTYDIPISDITRANNIPSVAKIEKDQLIFIPGADAPRDVVPVLDKSDNEFAWPLKGKVVTYFHERRGTELSKGIDISAQEGDIVKAARSGRVVFADFLHGYGQTVILDHMDGLYSVYARNAMLLVQLDQVVSKNTDIAQVGRSGSSAYLHFQIRKKSAEDNPLYYLP
ncbi:MAG TPA: peptidoglycan DD-metalloendopeptidase family protein [Candidatus Omnitrophota bacterium]|nr:peptidoglycan DD-metalloendopeptidase family protein [Candidatus Omnitrophota bacterium]